MIYKYFSLFEVNNFYIENVEQIINKYQLLVNTNHGLAYQNQYLINYQLYLDKISSKVLDVHSIFHQQQQTLQNPIFQGGSISAKSKGYKAPRIPDRKK